MPAPVVLPRIAWGDPSSSRHALLVHGLGSNGALMWRFGTALADAGWHAVAVDLRGHGLAPRAVDYTIDAYAADLAITHPDGRDHWELVVAHSLGGAAATRTAADHFGWTRRLVLIDPAIHLSAHDHEVVRDSQQRAFDDPTEAGVRAEHPTWHEHDVELKALSVRQASRWAVEQTSAQNLDWDVRDAAARLLVPTHVIASDPDVHSIFHGPLVDQVRGNARITVSVVAGAGHSPHRDQPDQTLRHLRDAIGD